MTTNHTNAIVGAYGGTPTNNHGWGEHGEHAMEVGAVREPPKIRNQERETILSTTRNADATKVVILSDAKNLVFLTRRHKDTKKDINTWVGRIACYPGCEATSDLSPRFCQTTELFILSKMSLRGWHS